MKSLTIFIRLISCVFVISFVRGKLKSCGTFQLITVAQVANISPGLNVNDRRISSYFVDRRRLAKLQLRSLLKTFKENMECVHLPENYEKASFLHQLRSSTYIIFKSVTIPT